jgi:hypothetical protein
VFCQYRDAAIGYSLTSINVNREIGVSDDEVYVVNAGEKVSHFSRYRTGASDPVERAPVGGDAVITLQQILNSLAQIRGPQV